MSNLKIKFKSKKKKVKRLGWQASLVCLILFMLTLAGPSLIRADNSDQSLYFQETGKTLSGDFLAYWQANGGVRTFGFPITDPAYEIDPISGQSYLTQWFERNRFELHPVAGAAQPTVQLGLLGREMRQEATKVDPDFQAAEPLLDPAFPSQNQLYFQETRHNLRFRFLQYWQEQGGLARFGFPISEEHWEFDPQSRTYYRTQWFERARFEYHPEKEPPNDVLLGLLGNQLQKGSASFNFEWKIGHQSSFLSSPNAVYADAKGNIYINDAGSGRVNKYNADHKLINYWNIEGGSQFIAGAPGDAAGSDAPVLYEIGQYRQDVQKLLPNGSWQTLKLGSTGEADSDTPNQALAVGEGGDLYILKYAQFASYLVWRYDAKGKFVARYVPRSAVKNPTGLAVKGSQIFLADGEPGQYKVFQAENNGDAAKAAGQTFSVPPGATDSTVPSTGGLSIAVSGQGEVYLGEAGQISRFDANGTFASAFGTPGRGVGQLYNPTSLTTDPNGNLYATDPANHRVLVFDKAGNYTGKLEDAPSNLEGHFAFTRAVATGGPAGHVWVADPVNNRVQEFETTGNFVRQWPANKIVRLAVSAAGDIYGLNSLDGLIIKYDPTGKPLAQWGGTGSGDGQFRLPGGLTVGPDGTLWVADTGNRRVQKFDKEGKFIAQWPVSSGETPPDPNDTFSGPTALAVEPTTGLVFVLDPTQNAILKFTQDGQYQAAIRQLDPAQPFEPLALSANPGGGLFLATSVGLYKLNANGSVIASALATTRLAGAGGGVDGDVSNLSGLAADGQSALFAVDNFGRLQKFRVGQN